MSRKDTATDRGDGQAPLICVQLEPPQNPAKALRAEEEQQAVSSRLVAEIQLATSFLRLTNLARVFQDRVSLMWDSLLCAVNAGGEN